MGLLTLVGLLEWAGPAAPGGTAPFWEMLLGLLFLLKLKLLYELLFRTVGYVLTRVTYWYQSRSKVRTVFRQLVPACCYWASWASPGSVWAGV